MRSASVGNYKKVLIEALLDFKCCKDSDVQAFLNSKAIRRGWTTTYLLLSKEKFEEGVLFVEGYFSLSHKAVVFEPKVSLSSRKKLLGFKEATTGSFVLIGQLGKRMELTSDHQILASRLTAADLLNDAMLIIGRTSEQIVCRNVIIECKPIEKVKKIYEDYGFSDLQYDDAERLHTLYLRLENNVLF